MLRVVGAEGQPCLVHCEEPADQVVPWGCCWLGQQAAWQQHPSLELLVWEHHSSPAERVLGQLQLRHSCLLVLYGQAVLHFCQVLVLRGPLQVVLGLAQPWQAVLQVLVRSWQVVLVPPCLYLL